MEQQIISKNKNRILLFSLLIYILINLLFLTRFPFVHSDEPWLSGLSRNILEQKDFSVTETFFDMYERNPHAIKSLFHTLQIIFIKIFGYSIFSVRLLSLTFSILTLYYFYMLCLGIFSDSKHAIWAVILLAIDIQYIYASHFARQEIILVFILVYLLYYIFEHIQKFGSKNAVMVGLVLGLSIGLHPNSFIIALAIAAVFVYHIFITKNIGIKETIICFITITIFALGFIMLSLKFDPNFFTNYFNYGSQFGVFYSTGKKVNQILYFYLKIFWGVSGTYYTPNIKPQFVLFGATLLISFYKLVRKGSCHNKHIASIIFALISINIGYVIIGRYNQTSIIFIFPLLYILVIYALESLSSVNRNLCITIIIIMLALLSLYNISPYRDDYYDQYLSEISTTVSPDSTVLANLNMEYYFENGKLFDYRNLTFLKDENISFSEYIKSHNIEYVIYSDEMDYIYNTRPIWNGLYGNVYFYYNDMIKFLNDSCTLEHTFNSSMYGNRIAKYINKKESIIKIYRVSQ